MKIRLIKRNGALMPESETDAELLNGLIAGRSYSVELTAPRNYLFHRKFFALLDVLFELFNPEPVFWRGMPAQKSRDRFRKDILIAVGHHELVVNIKGEVKAEAKSISFAAMDEPEFSVIYNAVLDYGLAKIATDKTRADIEAWVQTILDFA